MKYIIVLILSVSLYAQESRITTPAGNIVDVVSLKSDEYGNTDYILKWGNNNFIRTYSDTINTRYSLSPKIKGENSKILIVEISPRNMEWFDLILPLNKTEKVFRFEQAYNFDISRNLVAYCDDRSPNNDSVIVVENYITHQKQYFLADSCHLFSFHSANLSIYKVEFQNDSLYYEWQIQDPNSSTPVSRIKWNIAPITILNKQ